MSPPRKIRKTDDAGKKIPEPDGVIRFEVDNVSNLDLDKRFPEVEVKGMLWKMLVYHQESSLCVSLEQKHNKLTPSNINVDVECTLINNDSRKSVTEKASRNGLYQTISVDKKLINWAYILDIEKGFIKDDTITIEVRLWISNMEGVRIVPPFDFTDPNDPRHDIALVIEGDKVYVSKQILAAHSSFFNAMFYGDFVEKDKNEIELKDVDREEFLEMLHIVYPSNKKITDDSAKYLLNLGDRFEITSVMDRVEEYLAYHSGFSLAKKLKIADKYRLCGLLWHSIDKISNDEDLQEIKNSSFYNKFSDATKDALNTRESWLQDESPERMQKKKRSEPDGVIRFVAERALELQEGNTYRDELCTLIIPSETLFSHSVEVKGVLWRLGVFNRSELYVTLQAMLKQGTPWNIQVESECILINAEHEENYVRSSGTQNLTESDNRCDTRMGNSNIFAYPENGFFKDGKLTVKVRFWISNMKGIKTPTLIDFADPNYSFHDVALIIEEEKIYASKQILAIYSPVFYTMFYGEFAEKDKKEFELKDVNRQDFIDMLQVIYGSRNFMSDETALKFLKLGDEYQFKCVMEHAERSLINGNLRMMEKLRIADQYKLYELMKHAVLEFKTPNDFFDLKDSSLYKNLSDVTKDALLVAAFSSLQTGTADNC